VSGVLRFEGRDYQLTLLNLPTVTESYKTYDDINLVKTGDIGQVLVVGDISEEEANTGEISDGVTLPLRKARSRIFRKATPVSPEAVARVESQILDVLSVGFGGCVIHETNTICLLLQIAKYLLY
jgi:transcription initiation factor TFIID subunit 7